jgi:hypothetical protein
MKKIIALLLLVGASAFGQVLPADGLEIGNVKLLNVQVRDINGYKGPIFMIKYSSTAPAVWVRPSDPALNNSFLSFALAALSTGGTLTIVTGGGDNYGFRGITVMKFDDPPQ